MSKKHKKRKTSPLGSGGIGTVHFLRSGAGHHSPRKYGKRDRRAAKIETKEEA